MRAGHVGLEVKMTVRRRLDRTGLVAEVSLP